MYSRPGADARTCRGQTRDPDRHDPATAPATFLRKRIVNDFTSRSPRKHGPADARLRGRPVMPRIGRTLRKLELLVSAEAACESLHNASPRKRLVSRRRRKRILIWPPGERPAVALARSYCASSRSSARGSAPCTSSIFARLRVPATSVTEWALTPNAAATEASAAAVALPSAAGSLTRTTRAPSCCPPTPGRADPGRTRTAIRTPPVCAPARWVASAGCVRGVGAAGRVLRSGPVLSPGPGSRRAWRPATRRRGTRRARPCPAARCSPRWRVR